MPANWVGDTLKLYVGFISEDGTVASNNAYLGSATVPENELEESAGDVTEEVKESAEDNTEEVSQTATAQVMQAVYVVNTSDLERSTSQSYTAETVPKARHIFAHKPMKLSDGMARTISENEIGNQTGTQNAPNGCLPKVPLQKQSSQDAWQTV